MIDRSPSLRLHHLFAALLLQSACGQEPNVEECTLLECGTTLLVTVTRAEGPAPTEMSGALTVDGLEVRFTCPNSGTRRIGCAPGLILFESAAKRDSTYGLRIFAGEASFSGPLAPKFPPTQDAIVRCDACANGSVTIELP